MGDRGWIPFGTTAIGMTGVLASELAVRMLSASTPAEPDLMLVVLLASLAATIAFALRPLHRGAPVVLAVVWSARAGYGIVDALYADADIPLLVSAMEAATIAGAMLKLAARRTGLSDAADMLARAPASATLLLFAYVHVFHAPAIASMIPEWMPARSALPLISGSAMALAGILLWMPRFARSAALAVAIMFIAWLPLIHAARLASRPASAAEWGFAFMALCLAGCLTIVGHGRVTARRGGRSAATAPGARSPLTPC